MAWTLFETELGTAALAWGDGGIQRFLLPGGALPEQTTSATPAIRDTIRKAQRHLAGAPQSFLDAPLDFSAVSAFHRSVYRSLAQVPPGTTVSYSELATRAGSPGATRAVGTAMARNPWPLLVPCHRVLTERGSLGGFSAPGGVATKVRLLELEGLDIDPLRQLALGDARLGKYIASFGACGLSPSLPSSVFAALARSIVYQQLTGKAAATIFARVQALYPNGLAPARTAKLSDDALLACGLSRSKLSALRDLSARAAAGEIPDLEAAQRMDDEALIEALSTVRGIGRWSVQMFLMFSLGRRDVLPVGDYGVRKGFQKLYRLADLPTEAELEARGERWRPFRSIASWYLWRVAEGS